MAIIETGVFIFMIVFSFGFMIWAAIRSTSVMTNILRLVSIVMFFGLALFITSGTGVAATSTETINTSLINPLTGNLVAVTDTVTSQEVLIPEGDDGAWMGWIFLGFAFVSMALMVQDQWRVTFN
jgi:hypothetical protein